MSVLIETSLGDLVVDLDTEKCPRTCENFLKLCKSYRYNYLTFFSVQRDFVAQTGDPTNSGNGGQSVWSLLDPSAPKYTKEQYFYPERHASIRHTARGTLSMACRRLASNGRTFEAAEDEDAEGDPKLVAGSQFFVTLADNIDQLDDKHAPFGRVVEGQEKDGTLDKINAAFVDKTMRPLRDIRIQHVVVLDDPYQDPLGLHIPSHTPSPTPEQMAPIGLDASAELNDAQDKPEDEVQEERRKRDTNAAALTLEMVGDLPFAEVRPPENILFVCKLNPVTQSEDLELIFSRFGKILTCEVIRDRKTGDSLQYAFIEFDEQKSAEQAYFKMQNVLVDDRRIWVDFSQSVSKLSNTWNSGRAHGKPLKVTESKTSNGSGSSSSRQKHDSYNGGQRSSGEKDSRRQRDYRRSDYDRKRDDRHHSTKYEDRSGTSDSRSDRYDRQRRDFDRQGDRYERRDRERHEPYDRNRIEDRYRGNERYERSRSERHRDQRSPSPRQRRRDRD